VSLAILLAESTHENNIPVRQPVLATGDPAAGILALELGQKTGWAVRNADGAIASGTIEFKPGRFEGGGMVFLRFHAWLQEVDETAGGISTVYFEEVRSHRGVAAAHAYGGFLTRLTAWAADKDAVIAAVRDLGFDLADDNEADALALLD
jgi:hypothetical protein